MSAVSSVKGPTAQSTLLFKQVPDPVWARHLMPFVPQCDLPHVCKAFRTAYAAMSRNVKTALEASDRDFPHLRSLTSVPHAPNEPIATYFARLEERIRAVSLCMQGADESNVFEAMDRQLFRNNKVSLKRFLSLEQTLDHRNYELLQRHGVKGNFRERGFWECRAAKEAGWKIEGCNLTMLPTSFRVLAKSITHLYLINIPLCFLPSWINEFSGLKEIHIVGTHLRELPRELLSMKGCTIILTNNHQLQVATLPAKGAHVVLDSVVERVAISVGSVTTKTLHVMTGGALFKAPEHHSLSARKIAEMNNTRDYLVGSFVLLCMIAIVITYGLKSAMKHRS